MKLLCQIIVLDFLFRNVTGFVLQAGSQTNQSPLQMAPRAPLDVQGTGRPLYTGNLDQTPLQAGSMGNSDDIWSSPSAAVVQGASLRTWSFLSPMIEHVQVLMKTDGRPLNADLELWHGPDNTPQKLAVYIEDGSMRQFSAIIATPRGSNTVAIRNSANMEFPLTAVVEAEADDTKDLGKFIGTLAMMSRPKTVQGGAVKSYPFSPAVTGVQVLLQTDGRPLNARIELLQGPNNNKQIIEVYSEDGLERPFFAIFETPGIGNVVRIVNTATIEFPMSACVEAFQME